MSVGKVTTVSDTAYIRREGSMIFEELKPNMTINENDTIVVQSGSVSINRNGQDAPLLLEAGVNWQATALDLDQLKPLQNALNVKIEADYDGDQQVGLVSSDTFVISVALPTSLSTDAEKLVVLLQGTNTPVEVELTAQMRADGVVSIPYSFAGGSDYGVNYEFAITLADSSGQSLMNSSAKITLFEGEAPDVPGVSVTITNDDNNDGKLDADELAGVGSIHSEIALDVNAVAGDRLWVRENNGQWKLLKTLTAGDIQAGSVQLDSDVPQDGKTLKVEARIETMDGGLGAVAEDSAKVVIRTTPDAPSIVISEDADNNRILNSAELASQRTISTEITLGANNAVGDRLIVWQNGPRGMRGWKLVKHLTQEDVDRGSVDFEVQRPPENWTLAVRTRIIAPDGEKSALSAFDKAHIDTLGPKLTITTASPNITDEPVTVTFSFNEAPRGFVQSDIDINGGVLSNFKKVNGKKWTATFQADGSDKTPDITVFGRKFTDQYDNQGRGHKLTLELGNRKPEAPQVEITRDANNDGVINAEEMKGFRRIEVTFNLGDKTESGDSLYATINGNKKKIRVFTQEDIDKGSFTKVFENPGEGETFEVFAQVKTPEQEYSVVSNVDAALIDTIGPELTIEAEDQASAGVPTTVYFNFNDSPKGFSYDDITVTGGSLSGFKKVNGKQWKGVFTADGSEDESIIQVKGQDFTDINDNAGTGDTAAIDTNVDGITFNSEGGGELKAGFMWCPCHGIWKVWYQQGELELPKFTLNDQQNDEVLSIKLILDKSDSDYSNQNFTFGDWNYTSGYWSKKEVSFANVDSVNVTDYFADTAGAFEASLAFKNLGFNQTKFGYAAKSHTDTNYDYGIDFTLAVETRDTNTGKKTTTEVDFEVDVTEVTRWVTPLVLDLDGDGVETIDVADSKVSFDIDADGNLEKTGWVAADDGLLVRDINGDGLINDGSEMFGEGTNSVSGGKAQDGFAALAELDSNNDGIIDASDKVYSELKVWQDSNGDGISQAHELFSLVEMDVVSIDLSAEKISELDNGNIKGLRSSWTDSNGQQQVIDDVWFAVQDAPVETLDMSDLLASNEQLVSDVTTVSTTQTASSVACCNDTSLAALTRELLEQPAAINSDLG